MTSYSSTSSYNKRIARNTLMLYIRMLFIMGVTFYTSRVVLRVLGVEDYGIYNVVGGVVTMMSFLNSSLSTATQRFLNYEMGRGNIVGMSKVFCMAFWSYCLIALIALLLAETIGVWFVRTQLTIPSDRMDAALGVLHFSTLTFVVNLLSIPYTSTIIAHERMSIYAYISIIDVILKLLLVYFLQSIEADKLWFYALMMFGVACCMALAYRWSCLRLFSECRIKRLWDKNLFRGMFSFSGWMLAGTITNMFSTQGVNLLINIFFGPVYNAARGVAIQVYAAVNSFVANFMTAIRPSVVKSYAQSDYHSMNRLVFASAKICFYLLFILTIPILFNTERLLSLWLTVIPDYSTLFVQLVLFDMLINSIYTPIAYVSQASGKVRDYQLVISIGFALITMLTWFFFMMGYPVYTAFYIAIVVDVIGLFLRLWVLRRIMNFPVSLFLRQVMFPAVCVFIVVWGIAAISLAFFPKGQGLFLLLGKSLWCVGITIICIWFLGMNKTEKEMVIMFIDKIKRRMTC